MRERRKRTVKILLAFGIFLFNLILCMVKNSNAKWKPVSEALGLCCTSLGMALVRHHNNQQQR